MTCEGTVRRCFLHVLVLECMLCMLCMLRFLGLFSQSRPAVAAASFLHNSCAMQKQNDIDIAQRKPVASRRMPPLRQRLGLGHGSNGGTLSRPTQWRSGPVLLPSGASASAARKAKNVSKKVQQEAPAATRRLLVLLAVQAARRKRSCKSL